MPSFFLIITLVGLAIALVFAGRVEHSARRGLEKGMILAAIVAIVCVCLCVCWSHSSGARGLHMAWNGTWNGTIFADCM